MALFSQPASQVMFVSQRRLCFSGRFSRQALVGSEGVCAAITQLFEEMDSTSQPVMPLVMVKMLHMTIPRFAEKGEGGLV